MKKVTLQISLILIVGLMVSACSTATNDRQSGGVSGTSAADATTSVEPSASSTPFPTQKVEPQATLTPTDTASQTTTSTSVPTATSTSGPTATTTLSPTPTNSPTPDLVYNLPGFYPKSGCASYHLPKAEYNVDFCVLNVTINHDRHMVYTVSWTTHIPGKKEIRKRPDTDNRKMHLIDDLGKRYDHINVGGTASKFVWMKDGDTATGWFEFPPAQKEAIAFTFYDQQQDVSIGPFSFTAPIILTERTELTWQPIAVEYSITRWEAGKTEAGGLLLTHTEIPWCEIQEWPTSEIQGKYKNTLDLGGTAYEIYGWLEEKVGIREYLAVNSSEDLALETNLLFRASIPYDESLQCIFDISAVLGKLTSINPDD